MWDEDRTDDDDDEEDETPVTNDEEEDHDSLAGLYESAWTSDAAMELDLLGGAVGPLSVSEAYLMAMHAAIWEQFVPYYHVVRLSSILPSSEKCTLALNPPTRVGWGDAQQYCD